MKRRIKKAIMKTIMGVLKAITVMVITNAIWLYCLLNNYNTIGDYGLLLIPMIDMMIFLYIVFTISDLLKLKFK